MDPFTHQLDFHSAMDNGRRQPSSLPPPPPTSPTAQPVRTSPIYDILRPTYLYLFETEISGIYKFGIAYDIDERVKTAEKPSRYKTFCAAHYFDTRFQAAIYEQALIELARPGMFKDHSVRTIRSVLGWSAELTTYGADEFTAIVEGYHLDWQELGSEGFLKAHCPDLWLSTRGPQQGGLTL
jgi:hypothetical protein